MIATELSGHEASDRRVLIRASLFGFLLLLVLVSLLPSHIGPVFGLFNTQSNSMAPAYRVGSHVIASR